MDCDTQRAKLPEKDNDTIEVLRNNDQERFRIEDNEYLSLNY